MVCFFYDLSEWETGACPSQQITSSFGGLWEASEEQFKTYLMMT